MGRGDMALRGRDSEDLPDRARAADWPGWVPVATRSYLAHVEGGQTIRAIAKAEEVHPSTVLRRVRRMESAREDPLVDSALRRITAAVPPEERKSDSEAAFLEAALPVLRRLAEPDAVLAVARDLEKGVVMRSTPEGEVQRLAVVDRPVAVELALRGLIACSGPEARVQRYRITMPGRALLRRSDGGPGFAEGPIPFAGAEKRVAAPRRAAQAESPLAILSRRRDGSGQPFLSRELVMAGERLREDLRVAAEEGMTVADWDLVLARLGTPAAPDPDPGTPPLTGRARVEQALQDLGPGLADVALRTCCFQEGLEHVERRLGWSARSGKVVLKIALARLNQHYRAAEAQQGLLRD